MITNMQLAKVEFARYTANKPDFTQMATLSTGDVAFILLPDFEAMLLGFTDISVMVVSKDGEKVDYIGMPAVELDKVVTALEACARHGFINFQPLTESPAVSFSTN